VRLVQLLARVAIAQMTAKIRNGLLPGTPDRHAHKAPNVGTRAEEVTPADHMISLCHRARLLHRSLISPHAEEREILKHPSQRPGIGLRISSSTNRVEGEANAEDPPEGPVCDTVTEEVEENPG